MVAISGQARFDRRSPTVRFLERLVAIVVADDKPLWYTGPSGDLPPNVQHAVQGYVDVTRPTGFCVVPLIPEPLHKTDRPNRAGELLPPIGALVLERVRGNQPLMGVPQSLEIVCRHGSTALANVLEHRRSFPSRVWRLLRRTLFVAGKPAGG